MSSSDPRGPLPEPSRLGERLRELRAASGRSLRQLAGELGISPSALSQIERGAMRPSVNRLLAITTALGVPLADVFDETATNEGLGVAASALPATSYTVGRADEVAPVDLAGGVVFRRLSPAHTEGVDFFESVYPPNTGGGDLGEFVTHEGYEVGTVTAGSLAVAFASETVELGMGDSITFRCEVPHLITNSGDTPAVATWLIVHGGAGGHAPH